MESSGTPLVRDVRHHWRRNAFGTTRSCANVRHCRHPAWEVLRCHVLIADEVYPTTRVEPAVVGDEAEVQCATDVVLLDFGGKPACSRTILDHQPVVFYDET